MNNKKRYDFWKKHLKKCNELGMSKNKYSIENAISKTAFYQWSKKIAEDSFLDSSKKKSLITKKPSAFSEINVISKKTSTCCCRIKFNNFEILFDGLPDAEWIKNLEMRHL